MNMEATHAYVASCRCGERHHVGVVVDDPESPDMTADALAEFVRDGLTIERMTLDDARSTPLRRCSRTP